MTKERLFMILRGLITANQMKKTVSLYLKDYFPGIPDARMFGGHRPVNELYRIRADGKYIQIHKSVQISCCFSEKYI